MSADNRLSHLTRVAAAAISGLLMLGTAQPFPGREAENPMECGAGDSGFIQAAGQTICIGKAEPERQPEASLRSTPVPSSDGTRSASEGVDDGVSQQ